MVPSIKVFSAIGNATIEDVVIWFFITFKQHKLPPEVIEHRSDAAMLV
jgi:hypothetical protein